jgi:hypothetical protein
MAISRLSTEALDQIAEVGYALVPSCLDGPTLSELGDLLDAGHAGVRNLLDVPAVRRLAGSSAVCRLMEPVLGSNCFAVRGILFNKGDGANWKVAWHQDCVIAVAQRKEVPGWGPWSIKGGVHHVRPRSELMSRMLAVSSPLRRLRERERAIASSSGFSWAGLPVWHADSGLA